jgi:hypothetical protein
MDDDLRMHGSYRLAPGVLITTATDGTPWGDEIDKANARLIAAAPEILDALKASNEKLETLLFAGKGHPLIAANLAAIAKAEGR